MKKVLLFIIAISIFCSICSIPVIGVAQAKVGENGILTNTKSPSLYLVDYDSGTVLLEKNAEEKRPIASMVKIMTLVLTFKAINEGKLSYDEMLTISETAAGMGGSQMFLDVGEKYSVSDLIKGVTVCSANDAATALGERIAGSIEAFVQSMNDYAKELGMNNTKFCNATGLPNSGEQFSTAKDVTTMLRELLKSKKYFEYSRIWMEDYTHPDGRKTEMVNTNKLIRFYKDCDAGKTGFTNEAMFCLSASAKVNDMRVIATVLGSPDSKTRFKEITDLFKYAFANYENKVLLRANEVLSTEVKVNKAKEVPIEVYCDRDIKYFCKKGENKDYKVSVCIFDNLTAPISKETPLGMVRVTKSDGEIICEGKIYSRNDIPKATYKDALEKVLRNWLIK